MSSSNFKNVSTLTRQEKKKKRVVLVHKHGTTKAVNRRLLCSNINKHEMKL